MKRELHAHEAKIASLHDVASKLDDCETREEIYEVTVTAAEEVLQFDVCVVDMVEGSLLVKKAVSTGLDVEVEQTMSVEEGIAGKTYRTGRTHRVDDITTNPTAKTESDEFRSVLSIPIGDHGVFQAVSSDFAAFDHDDQELAELLLSHVSDALERFDFEAEIRAERDRFAALFENVPDAAVSTRQRSADAPPIIEASILPSSKSSATTSPSCSANRSISSSSHPTETPRRCRSTTAVARDPSSKLR